jgi:hypothetical protein
MRKKEKLERAIAKMGYGTPEGKRLAQKIEERERKKQERKDNMMEITKFVGFVFGIVIISCIVLAALICPLYFYGDNTVTIVATNLSDSEYAYILKGDSNLHVKYFNEQRNSNDSTIIFAMYVSYSWTIKNVMVEFLDNGNLNEKVEFYYEEKNK